MCPTSRPRLLLAGLDAPADAAKVVVLTHNDSQQELLATLRTGVRGYGIHSSLEPEDIRSGLLTVARGFRWLCPQATSYLLLQLAAEDGAAGSGGAGPLSPREAEVLALAAEGEGEEQIAVALCLSRNTVKTYLRRIREKLQASSRGEAVRLGYEQGLIPLPEATGAVLPRGMRAARRQRRRLTPRRAARRPAGRPRHTPPSPAVTPGVHRPATVAPVAVLPAAVGSVTPWVTAVTRRPSRALHAPAPGDSAPCPVASGRRRVTRG